MHHFDAAVFEKWPQLKEIFESIGNTSLILLESSTQTGNRFYGKLEYENPWGTIKDRVAFGLVYNYLKTNPSPDSCLLEYTGGSLGIALSGICAQLGLNLEIVASDFVSTEFLESLRRNSVHAHLVPKDQGFWAVMEKAVALANKDSRYHLLYQHENQANPWIHALSTGNEWAHFLKQQGVSKDQPVYLVASVGTGGTLNGIHRSLTNHGFDVRLVVTCPKELPYGSMDAPNGDPKFAGSGGLGHGRKQRFLADLEHKVDSYKNYTYSEALEGSQKYFQKHGVPVGTSAGANYIAGLEVFETIPNACVITVFASKADGKEGAKICQS